MNVDWSWTVAEDYGLMVPLPDSLEQALMGESGGASAFSAGRHLAPPVAVH